MPHITIEYSANVADHHDIEELVAVIHAAALDHGLPALDALRTRAARRDHYRIADGQPGHAFIAIEAHIGPGRDAATKTSFLEHVLDAAEGHVASKTGGASETGVASKTQPNELAIAWSIEITEIDAEFRINRNHVRTRLQETT